MVLRPDFHAKHPRYKRDVYRLFFYLLPLKKPQPGYYSYSFERHIILIGIMPIHIYPLVATTIQFHVYRLAHKTVA
jgi:hypothetical protein